jgi:hypothetical protein
MRIWNQLGAVCLGTVVVAMLAALPLVAQEPPKSETAAPAGKRATDPSRRVPDFFGQIGLTATQKEDVYKIRAKHQKQIDALEEQIAKVRADMLAECETLLTENQKQLLTGLRKASAEAKAARKKEQPKKSDSNASKPAEKPSK